MWAQAGGSAGGVAGAHTGYCDMEYPSRQRCKRMGRRVAVELELGVCTGSGEGKEKKN